MAGPTQPWDQPEDPREQTVDLPRIGPPGNGNGRAASGSHAGYSGEPGRPPSRNGHSPAANGTPQWPVTPDSPLRGLPDVNGDPYAQPDQLSRPGSLFEPPPRAAAPRPTRPPRPEPSMPPVPPASPLPAPRSMPPVPLASGTRPSAPAEAAAPESAERFETPSDAPSSSLPQAEESTDDDAGSARPGETAVAPQAPTPPVDADVPRAAADRPAEAAPAASAAQGTQDQQSEPPPRAAASNHRRPARGSLADLRSRLDQLPDGHPSSPYDDGGAAKPMPHRLKQLELGLPAPERDAAETSFRFSHPMSDTSENEQAGRSREPSRAEKPASPASEPASPASDPSPSGELSHATAAESGLGQPNTALPPANGDRSDRAWTGDKPEQSASAPEASSPNGAKGHHFGPADTWQDPYAHEHGRNERATRERRRPTDPAMPPRQEPRPAARPAASRSGQGEPTDPHRRDRSWPNGQLSGEDKELVAALLADGRAAEGRASTGGYGASGLTPVIRRIADQLPGGRLAPGSEATSLKSAERLSAKLARLIARHPDRTASELAVSICDVVRYAFAFEPESYAEGTWLVHRKLKAQGFELEARRNRWETPECKGVWTRWRDPASDLSFEIQFHTFASWDVFVNTHEAYRTITDPATSPGERARLRARQVAGSARAKAPPGCAEIVDFAKGAR